MPKRSPSSSSLSPTETKPMGPFDILAPYEIGDEIKVNNSNLAELKNACDDVLKKYLSRPGLFTQNHRDTDVKLVLGYSAVAVALVTAWYGYRLSFEESKPGVTIGLCLYLLLSGLSALYSWAVEQDVVFRGKRKNFAGRIETDRISLSSKTDFPPPSYATLFARFLLALSPKASKGPAGENADPQPTYSISFAYTLTASSGRSLLAKRTASHSRPYSTFFDDKGVMLQQEFTAWLGSAVQKAISGDS